MTPQQGRVLVEQVAGLGGPHPTLVLSGRDPFARPDLWELLGLARDLNLRPVLSTLGTPELDLVCLERLRSSGAHTLCLSLDASTPVTHDAHHGIPGSFASTRQICQLGHRLGLRMQLATLVGRHNLGELGRILQHVLNHGVLCWTVSFPGGRTLTGPECEAVLHFLARAGQQLGVLTSEGHHLQRVLRLRAQCWSSGVCPEDGLLVGGERLGENPLYRRLVDYLPPERPRLARGGRLPAARSGSAQIFIDAQGEVRPTPWLPLSAGNVRTQELVNLYRGSWLFGQRRDPERLGGRCAQCEFRQLCGDSWARSYEVSASVDGEDPVCGFEPGNHLASRRAATRARKARP